MIAQRLSSVLAFDADAAQVWSRLRAPHPENLLDSRSRPLRSFKSLSWSRAISSTLQQLA
jgi:hypothetical protein